MTASVKGQTTRAEFADRLLKGSVRKSYAPIVDIDWDAPLEPDKFFLPPQVVSLYGTELWESMSRAEQIELSRQELVNTLSAGIWFENILNQALLRKMMHQDPTSSSTHYELTELGDETRHMVMFGKAIAKVGADPVRPKLYQRMIINTLPFFFRGSTLWVAALIGEEIFDSLQRQMLDDPELQPMVQRLMRIHVSEEARHIQFARDGLRKRTPGMSWAKRFWVGNLNGIGGPFFRFLLTNKVQYRRVGLDARRARTVARNSPHRIETQIAGFAPLATFLNEVGLLGPIARRLWRRSGFLPAASIGAVSRVEIADAEDVYDGPATVDGRELRVRLAGHLDPIDGLYHWRGTVFDLTGEPPRGSVTMAVGQCGATARVAERSPQGGYSVSGTGLPPFPLT